MTPPAASSRPWALWTTLLAILLALQASAGAIRPSALADAGAVAAKLTLPAPLTAQLREPGQALKAAGQRHNAAKPDDGQDGTPPLPAYIASIRAPAIAATLRHRLSDRTGQAVAPASAYHARAPPLSA